VQIASGIHQEGHVLLWMILAVVVIGALIFFLRRYMSG